MTSVIRPLLLILAVVLGAVTVAVALVPGLSFGYESPTAHVALETAAAVISLLAASILLGRLRQRRSASELLLFAGLAMLVVANVVRAVIPSFDGGNPEVVWVPLVASTFAAAVLATAPFVSGGDFGPRAQLGASAAIVGAGVLTMLVAALVANSLSTGIDPAISPADSNQARVIGSPGLLAMQLVAMSLYALSAVGYAGRAERTGDELLAWFSIAMALAALARLNYFLFPSSYSDWVFTGDFLRLATYLALLVGALREIAGYQRAAARAAVLEERARIARDLHDGLAQDLAYVSMQGMRAAKRDPAFEPVAEAARDALARSRDAIKNLRVGEDSLPDAITTTATALAERHDTVLELEVDEGADVAPEIRDDLLFVLREAVSNAARHGQARTLRVALSPGSNGGVEMAIVDDGRGFDMAATSSRSGGGYGLAGIAERAARHGGSTSVESRPGAGTTVRIVIP